LMRHLSLGRSPSDIAFDNLRLFRKFTGLRTPETQEYYKDNYRRLYRAELTKNRTRIMSASYSSSRLDVLKRRSASLIDSSDRKFQKIQEKPPHHCLSQARQTNRVHQKTRKHFDDVQELNLESQPVIDAQLKRKIQQYPNLKRVNLRNCVRLSPEGLSHLTSLKNLERLVLSRTSVTDSVCNKIVKKCTRLQHLMVCNCAALTAGNLSRLSQENRHLDIRYGSM
jgi:hypothetical protein